jgi:transposase
VSTRASSPPRRLVDDELWALLEPLIPSKPAGQAPGGRPRLEDRQAVEGILFVLTTGIGWAKLPAELGFGSGWTAWRRLRERQAAGVWDRLHRAVLDELNRRQLLDWSRAVLDSASVRAKRGAR